MLGQAQFTVGGDDRGRLLAGLLEDGEIPREAGGAELRQSRLTCAEELAVAAQLEIDLRDPEAVVGVRHRIHAAPGVVRQASAGEQDAVRLPRSAADAAAQLVELGKT